MIDPLHDMVYMHTQIDPAVEEWLVGLGPFSDADRKMIALWTWFRTQMGPIKEKHEVRSAAPG